jgi:hypothetical protein
MTAKESTLPHPLGGQTNNVLPKLGVTPGESSYYSSLTVTSSSFNPSTIGRFTNIASDPVNGTTLQTQTYYLNGQAHIFFSTTNKEGHSTDYQKKES